MASNFSIIPIRWLLTVDSKMTFSFSIHSLRVCLFSFKTHAVQEKFRAKLINSKVNFTRKTDIVLIAALCGSCNTGFGVKYTAEFTG